MNHGGRACTSTPSPAETPWPSPSPPSGARSTRAATSARRPLFASATAPAPRSRSPSPRWSARRPRSGCSGPTLPKRSLATSADPRQAWSKKRAGNRRPFLFLLPITSQATTRSRSVVVIVVVAVVVVPVPVDLMGVHGDAAVVAAADPRTHRRRIATGTDHGDRRRLRHEDEVAVGIRRHRVRAGRLRDGFDQDAGRVDHPEHGLLVRGGRTLGSGYFAVPVGARVVASIALVEPHFIRADDPVHVRE